MSKAAKILITIAIVAVLGLTTFFGSLRIIPTGYTGVKSVFGQVSDKPLPKGANFVIPFVTKVEKVCNKQQEYRTAAEQIIWGETISRTAVQYSGITVTYSINPDFATWIVANVNDYENNLLTYELISSAVKSTSKQLEDTKATDRALIEDKIATALQESLNEKYDGDQIITIHKVIVGNADFEDSYNQSIADKQKAQLEYEKQQIENKKALEKAENDAAVKKAEAQGKADAAIIEAEGVAEANELLNKSLTDKVLENKTIEKWDGKLPTVSGSDGLIIDMPATEEKK